MSEYHILIPARLASTRLPEKALADVCGKPLVVRVWERCLRAGADSVHVATDSQRIADAVESAGGRVVRTRPDHDSGTSRIAEAVDRLALDSDSVIVNVQGDEPAVPVACIEQVVALLDADRDAHMATLHVPLDDREQWLDPNVVKVVTDHAGRALYFSRAPIPADRDRDWPVGIARRHVGLYGYRAGALRGWPDLPASALAESESLEQLRPLQAGWRIVCGEAVAAMPPGVDTPADLEAMRQRFSGAALTCTCGERR